MTQDLEIHNTFKSPVTSALKSAKLVKKKISLLSEEKLYSVFCRVKFLCANYFGIVTLHNTILFFFQR